MKIHTVFFNIFLLFVSPVVFGDIINITGLDDFNKKIEENKLVLVDFWAPWCAPCKQLTLILEEIANEYSNWTIIKVNIDDLPKIAENHDIRSLPTLILYNKGQEEGNRHIGALSKDELITRISSVPEEQPTEKKTD